MPDIRIEIQPAPDAQSLMLRIPVAENIKKTRFSGTLPFLDLDATLLQAIRGADPDVLQRNMVLKIGDSLRQWLILGGHWNDLLDEEIAACGESDTLRLILIVDAALRDKLFDLPFELITGSTPGKGLILEPYISGILRYIPKPGGARNANVATGWPLRVLLVRSNPGNMGGVPPALPISEALRGVVQQHERDGFVQIVTLTSESLPKNDVLIDEEVPEDKLPPVSWRFLQNHLRKNPPYHILIYLGHGDINDSSGGAPSIGKLQMEDEQNPELHADISAPQIAALLEERPTPLVLLIGCLTAAQNANLSDSVLAEQKKSLPEWMRGCQSVAQAVVDSQSGVQIAVGMRDRLEADNAQVFLESFFDGLLNSKRRPGDVEAAVCFARNRLLQAADHPPAWASPVLFSTLYPEPLFRFLGEPITLPAEFYARQQESDEKRRVVWETLLDLPPRLRTDDVTANCLRILTIFEHEWVSIGKAFAAPVLMPSFAQTTPGQSQRFGVTLIGDFAAQMVSGRVRIANGAQFARITEMVLSNAALQSGWRLLFNADGYYRLEREEKGTLPPGVLFTVEATPPAPNAAIYDVSLTAHVEGPSSPPVACGTNALLALAP